MKRLKAALAKLDAGDIKFLVGLALVAYGIALVSVPSALITTGAILLIGFYAAEAVKIFRSKGRTK